MKGFRKRISVLRDASDDELLDALSLSENLDVRLIASCTKVLIESERLLTALALTSVGLTKRKAQLDIAQEILAGKALMTGEDDE